MATPAANIPVNLSTLSNKQRTIDNNWLQSRLIFSESTCNYPVANNINGYFTNYFLENSEDNSISKIDQTIRPNTKSFVKHFQKFVKEYNQNKDRLKEFSAESVRIKFSSSLSYFLKFKPDAFSIEISEDGTLFYTIKKNNFSFYIDQYIVDEENGDEEFILTSFDKNNMGVVNSGNISSILDNMRDIADHR